MTFWKYSMRGWSVLGLSLFVSMGLLTQVAWAKPMSSVGRDYTKSDEAEVCEANNGRFRVLRGFTNPFSFFVEFTREPGVRPDVKEGYMHVQESGGQARLSAISFQMFSLIADTFGDAPKTQDQWKSTYQKVYEGPVTVYDETGTLRTTFIGTCHSVIVEFK